MLVSRFLVERLENSGLKHVFGVPGDYVLGFYKDLWDNKNIQVINNTDENHAGFAADAYARIHGIGCVVVAYDVGTSKVLNAVQCAYAERSPLVVIAGAPGKDERPEVGNLQRKLFDDVTCASVVLDDPTAAGYQIDYAFESLNHYKRPIYIELPRDVAKKPLTYDVYKQGTPVRPATDNEALREAVTEVVERIRLSERPVILAGVEVGRCDFGSRLIRFAERFNVPLASTLLGKSVVGEESRCFCGVYSGYCSTPENVKSVIQGSDCVIILGENASIENQIVAVKATIDGLRIGNHVYPSVEFSDFCEHLLKTPETAIQKKDFCQPDVKKRQIFEAKSETSVTVSRLFEKIDSLLTKEMAVVADMGDALYGSADLTMPMSYSYWSPAYYTSMGNAIPGALGIQTACPEIRPLVVVGDGAFQMSFNEISTILARKLNPIIVVIDNGGYATERAILDGDFNNIPRWNYHKISELFGGGFGQLAETEEQLEVAFQAALDCKSVFVINVRVQKGDISQRLRKITDTISRKG